MKWPLVTIVTIIIAIIGVASPIVWDVAQSQKVLELRIISSISLFGKDPILERLEIRYGGKEIRDLTKFVFVIVNTGRRPIVEQDVKKFPEISFGPGSEVLATEILRSDPPDLGASIEKGMGRMTLKFSLLNPTDFVEFGAYVSAAGGTRPEITARIEEIKALTVVDKTREATIARKETNPVVNSIVAVFAAFSGLVALVAAAGVRQQLGAGKLLRKEPELLKNLAKADFEQFIHARMGFVTSSEKDELTSLLAEWKEPGQDANVAARLRALIEKRVMDASGSVFALVFMLLITSAGVIYLMVQFIP